jgi:hypothetical protein
MKWTEDKDKELEKLISDGFRYSIIADIMGTTYKSIMNRAHRLGVKTIYHKKTTCLNCGIEFESTISHNRKFCGSSCSAIFNNKGRVVTEEQKQKVREKLTKPKKEKIIKPKVCRFCGETDITGTKKIICDVCKKQFYKFYKPLCVFDFNIKNYDSKFDLSIVNVYGWYSPKNKGNNLNGVSKDHMYSVRDGFINKIDPEIIKHPANCQLMLHNENNSKNYNSSITIDDLIERIKNW